MEPNLNQLGRMDCPHGTPHVPNSWSTFLRIVWRGLEWLCAPTSYVSIRGELDSLPVWSLNMLGYNQLPLLICSIIAHFLFPFPKLCVQLCCMFAIKVGIKDVSTSLSVVIEVCRIIWTAVFTHSLHRQRTRFSGARFRMPSYRNYPLRIWQLLKWSSATI